MPLGPLPRDVHPLNEALALDIDPSADGFAGTAEISLRLDRSRSQIWLHGRGLTVASASLVTASGEHLSAKWEQVDPSGVASITPSHPIGPGEATLRIAFTAAYDPQLVGVYRVKTGVQAAVFSKFEAIYARRAFPCFDEPEFKSPFEITLTVPVSQMVIGNLPIVEDSTIAGKRRVRLAKTPPLPAYLVAFTVGPFERRDETVPANALRSAPLAISAIALRGRGKDAGVALDEAPALLGEHERYFGIPFPFPKLDLIAAPDFQSGAMENAGAILFRDSLLLVDEKVASLRGRIDVASTISHEMAHQWFGDMVTMRWWDDLWINESFASFLGQRTLRAIEPELELELEGVDAANRVMNLDGLASARRIRQPIESTHDITNAFDRITYAKGEAVLGMFEHFLGREVFRRGLHRYLVEHAWANGTTDDLVAALSKEAGRELGPLFSSFLDQPGVPLVRARLTCEETKGRVLLEQSRWLPAGSTALRNVSWQVPVCVRAGVAGHVEEACMLLDNTQSSMELSGCADWVMPNADAAGYYRFALASGDLAHLQTHGMKALTTAERMALVHNLEAAFRSVSLPAGDVLAALDVLAQDRHGAVAMAAMSLFTFVDDFMLDEPLKRAFRAYLAHRYAPVVADLGWKSSPAEKPWRRLFRAKLLDFLALQLESRKVLEEAARIGRSYLGVGADDKLHPSVVDADLAATVLAAAARTGGYKLFDALQRQLVQSSDAQARARLLAAMANVREPALIGRALDLALHPRLRQNERLATVQPLLADVATRERAWEWIKTHFDSLAPLLPDRYGGRLPRAPQICDAAAARDLHAFFAPRVANLSGGPRNLAQALETAAVCGALVEAQRESTRAFVRSLANGSRF
jgi:alanyl aminopeptidase